MDLLAPYLPIEGEKPLDRIVDDGGLTAIFRTIACIGDSLSSGEFESTKADGTKGYHDYYDYSWGQYIGRMVGAKVYNFSKGGMTAKNYMEEFADRRGLWAEEKAAQAYILALGVNDLHKSRNFTTWHSLQKLKVYVHTKNLHTGVCRNFVHNCQNLEVTKMSFSR